MESSMYVPIYVPAELAPEVYERIRAHLHLAPPPSEATSDADDQGSRAPESVEAARTSPPLPVADTGDPRYVEGREADLTWPDDLLRRLYEDSSPRARGILDCMIDRPDEKCTTNHFVMVLGFDGPNAHWQVPGVLGGITKRMRSRYGRDWWPFAWAKDEAGNYSYWMPASVAAKFKAFRDEA
jgi:hypothetical protein